MVVGVGVDIVKVKKMEKAVKEWGKTFLNKVFNDSELAPLNKKSAIYYQRLAARFAAKEAVVKSLGKEISLALKDIVITNLESGMPVCKLKALPAENLDIFISLSHIEDYAVATAIAQKKSPKP